MQGGMRKWQGLVNGSYPNSKTERSRDSCIMSTRYVGLDVQDDTILTAALDSQNDETVNLGHFENNGAGLENMINALCKDLTTDICFLVKSDGHGFGLYQRLTTSGFSCILMSNPNESQDVAGLLGWDAITLAKFLL